MQDGRAERQPLFPAAGQVLGQIALAACQPGHLQDRLLAQAQPFATYAVGAGVEIEIFDHGQVVV